MVCCWFADRSSDAEAAAKPSFDYDDFDMTRRQDERGDAAGVRFLRVSVNDDVGITNGTGLGP